MRDLSDPARYGRAVAAIEAASADDPGRATVGGVEVPLAVTHGRLAVAAVEALVTEPSEALLLAARAHHIRRFDLPRSGYPEGRAGYLRWRRDQKDRHAALVGTLLARAGYPVAMVERVGALVKRVGLGTDPETQAVEDAACLAFVQTQLDGVAARLDRARLLEVLRRTLGKMSPAAVAHVMALPLTATQRGLVRDATDPVR